MRVLVSYRCGGLTSRPLVDAWKGQGSEPREKLKGMHKLHPLRGHVVATTDAASIARYSIVVAGTPDSLPYKGL